MGTGFLTGQFTSWEDLKDGDFRKVAHKRMTKEAFVEVRLRSSWQPYLPNSPMALSLINKQRC
jgi:hypothetical protein